MNNYVEVDISFRNHAGPSLKGVVRTGLAKKVFAALQENFPDDGNEGWRTEAMWEVEAESVQEAEQKITQLKKEAEEACIRFTQMHEEHWERHGGPIRLS